MKDNCRVTIDMNLFPKLSGYGGVQIDWAKTVGMSIPFSSGDTTGFLTILDNNKTKVLVKRSINGSNNNKEIWINHCVFLHGDFSRSLFNEVAFTRPDLIKYFTNKEDVFYFVKTTRDKTYFTCPCCGFTKKISVSTVNGYGFACDRCTNRSNGYPNKFMISFLEQLDYEYITEANKHKTGFGWLEDYRFDFLINTKTQKYFIEMDGYFHFNDNKMNGKTVDESKATDEYKDRIANQHGYEVIRIDCNYKGINNRFNFIKNNIIQSKLMSILRINEDDIDWNKCDKDGQSNILYTICDCWNDGIKDINKIAKHLGISWSCVYSNITKGASLGLCDYDSKKVKKEMYARAEKEKGQPIKVILDNMIVGVFPSSRELSRQSESLFGSYFNPGHISHSRRKGVLCHGYHIQDITREEYEQLLPQILNNTKLM